MGSNQDIHVGNSVSFGFNAKYEGKIILPSQFDIMSYEASVPSDMTQISYEITERWSNGFNGEIKIKNLSDKTIEDWTLGFEFQEEINQFWCASVIEHVENYYYIKNGESNQNIEPGETIAIGFKVHTNNMNVIPLNYSVYQVINQNIEEEVEIAPLESDRKRVEEINQTYNENFELIKEYYLKEESNLLAQIEENTERLYELGVEPLTDKEIEEKMLIENEISTYQTVPSSTKDCKYSSYRFNTVIRGYVYEMQVITAEPTGTLNGYLVNGVTILNNSSKNYGEGMKASAITVVDIALSDLIGKIPGGTLAKNLYDICKSGTSAMSSTTIVIGTKTSCTTYSQNTLEKGYLKKYGTSDVYQEMVYAGNKVEMTFFTDIFFSKKVNDSYKTYRSSVDNMYTFKSRCFDSISLTVTQSPLFTGTHRIITNDEIIYKVPYKFFGTSYSHKICSSYEGSMMEYYDF